MVFERFPAAERRLLLSATGIGEVVVQRLEAAGCASMAQLRAIEGPARGVVCKA